MTLPLLSDTSTTDALYIRLAREIAADIHPLDKVLANYAITPAQWETIKENSHFQRLLMSEIEAWNSALNAHERVKLKSAAMIEEALPEVFARVHDKGENLNHKAELLKWLKDLAGMGVRNANVQGGGERLSITINLGADQKLEFKRDAAPVIEGELAGG